MEKIAVFRSWDDTIATRLEAVLSRNDFLIVRGRALRSCVPPQKDYYLQFAGSASIILLQLQRWVAEMETVLQHAVSTYPETFTDYFFEMTLLYNEIRGLWYPKVVFVGPTLIPTDEPEKSEELSYGRIVRTGKARFRMYLEPPPLTAQRIREDVLWHRRASIEEQVLCGRLHLLPEGYMEQFAPGEIVPLPPPTEAQLRIILEASPEDQYNYFFIDCDRFGYWALCHPQAGWFWLEEGGQRILPLWPLHEFADLYAEARDLQGYDSAYIEREVWEEAWLPKLRESGCLIEVFPLPWRSGYRLTVEVFEAEQRVAVEANLLALLPRLRVPGRWVAVLEGEDARRS